jgi:hypothetical protein
MAIPRWIKTLDTCKLLRNIIYIILHPFFWNPILLRVEVIRMEWQVQSVSNPFCWIIALETTHNYHNFFSKWVYQKLECSKNSSSSISPISLVILGIILIPPSSDSCRCPQSRCRKRRRDSASVALWSWRRATLAAGKSISNSGKMSPWHLRLTDEVTWWWIKKQLVA